MAKYDFLIADADNTLLDFSAAESRAFYLTCSQYSLGVGPEEYDAYKKINRAYWEKLERGETRKELMLTARFADFFALLGSKLPPDEFNRAFLFNLSFGSDLVDGALELCREVSAHISIIIATNAVASSQTRRLRGSAIYPYISEIVISEHAGYEKPDRRFFEYLFQKTAAKPTDKILMLGDSAHADIKGAAAVGADTCYFRPDGKPAPDGILPTYAVTSLHQVARLVI